MRAVVMEFFVTVLVIASLGWLSKGAWLMMQDSEVKHKVRKELQAQHPHLSREQLRDLTYKKLNEMALNEQRH